jgi:hypothetical protein
MKLITETVMDVDYLVEDSNGKKSHFIEGVFMQAEKPNRNGRVYPKSVLENELNKYQTAIKEKRSMGELGHPENPSLNLDKVSHLITELKFDGNDIIGKAKIMNTPMGNIARNFLEEGVKLGVSSRGMGSLIKKGEINEVQKDFRLATVDIVHEPSGIDCWVNGIMENAEWIYEATSDSWKLAEQFKKDFQSKSAKQLAEVQASCFQKFLSEIK